MSSYYKLRIQDLEASRLKLIGDITELRAELEKTQKQLKQAKTRVKKVLSQSNNKLAQAL